MRLCAKLRAGSPDIRASGPASFTSIGGVRERVNRLCRPCRTLSEETSSLFYSCPILPATQDGVPKDASTD